MKRVVFDTNVLVSATLWDGAAAQLVRLAQSGRITLVLSLDIVEEYRIVLCSSDLQRKVRTKGLQPSINVQKLLWMAEIIMTKTVISASTDPDDNIILECAIDGDAEYIVTYDDCLLALSNFRGVHIMTPESALRVFSHEHS